MKLELALHYISQSKHVYISIQNSFIQEKEKIYWIIQNDYLSLQSKIKNRNKHIK